MNADRLLAHYERIADAPDAIARLRRFILDLAARGKLVEQEPNDEPAVELLKRIAAEKVRLVKAKEIRNPRPLPSISGSEIPFDIPSSWTWVQIDNLSPKSLTDGDWIETKDQSEDGGVRLIQLADVGDRRFLDKSARFLTEETEKRLNCTRLEIGDVLIARLPNPIGRACIFPNIGQPAITAVDVAILRLDNNLNRKFATLVLNAPATRGQIEAYGKGSTRFRVSTGHLKTVLVPLPPLAEQHRIVAKVDELMALCDRLEARRAEREATRDRMAAASLVRLNDPDPDPVVFRKHAAFAIENLTPLTTRRDQIKVSPSDHPQPGRARQAGAAGSERRAGVGIVTPNGRSAIGNVRGGLSQSFRGADSAEEALKADRAGLCGKPADRLELGNTAAMRDTSSGLQEQDCAIFAYGHTTRPHHQC